MFPQKVSPDFESHRGPLKRFHDDVATTSQDGLTGETSMVGTADSIEHRNKRLHTLPFRTSPSAQKVALGENTEFVARHPPLPSSTMTPPGSISESAPSRHPQDTTPSFGSSAQASISASGGMIDTDTDMDMSVDGSASSAYLAPGPFQPVQDSIVASRIPTPIQPNFAAQVRGSNWSGAADNVMHATSVASSMHHLPGPFGSSRDIMSADYQNYPNYTAHAVERSVPRSLEQSTGMVDWNMVQNRSLPSPISEGGMEDVGAPEMILDSMASKGHGTMDSDASHHHMHEHGDLPGIPGHIAAGGGTIPSSPLRAASSPIRATMDGSSEEVSPSPKKGHSRSRHTLVAWTQQPGMKKSFSIGYRADCEKCRNRVPGHFNHIIVS